MPLRIGVAGAYLDGFSGVPRRLTAALAEHADVELMPLPEYRPPLVKRMVARAARVGGRDYLWDKDPRGCRTHSRALDEHIARASVDAVLLFGSEACAFSEARVPLFAFGDSLFGTRIDLYPDQVGARIAGMSMREGKLVQQRALDRLRGLFLTSRWSLARAVERCAYRIDEAKLVVTGVGANLPWVESAPPFPSTGAPRFLWMGLDWERKGGAFAVSVVDALRARGVPATLDVVGDSPADLGRGYVTVYGRVTDDAQRSTLFASASAMLLPTRGDISPIAIAEAAAHGRATIATPVGGIPELVRDGEEALLLDGDSAYEWAEEIGDALADGRLATIGSAARAAYETRLNWPMIARRIVTRISEEVA